MTNLDVVTRGENRAYGLPTVIEPTCVMQAMSGLSQEPPHFILLLVHWLDRLFRDVVTGGRILTEERRLRKNMTIKLKGCWWSFGKLERYTFLPIMPGNGSPLMYTSLQSLKDFGSILPIFQVTSCTPLKLFIKHMTNSHKLHRTWKWITKPGNIWCILSEWVGEVTDCKREWWRVREELYVIV